MASKPGTPSKAQLLLEAAFTGNLPRLKKLVAELGDGKGIAKRVAAVKDAKGLSAIHFAEAAGRLDVCKYLINGLKVDVDLKDGKGLKTDVTCLEISSPRGRLRHPIVGEKFDDMKAKREAAFREKDYLTAILWYSRANEIDPSNAIVLSNRSLCWARLKEGDNALTDAESCIKLNPNWAKAHYRAGAAFTISKKFDEAAKAFLSGLKLDPTNKELRSALRETYVAMEKAKEGK